MTNERKALIHRIYAIALSVSTVIAGLCLMAACLGIYRSGDQPYSREAVAAAFSPIAPAVYTFLALTVGGFVLDALLPLPQEKLRPARNTPLILDRLRQRTDLSACPDDLRSRIASLEPRRRRNGRIGYGIAALCALVFLAYALNPGNYDTVDITGSVIRAVALLLPCAAIPCAWFVWAAYWSRRSMENEIDLLKQAGSPASPGAPEAVPPKKDRAGLLRCLLLTLGAALLLWGYFTGGTADVLTKAVNICTECVGLG